MVCGIRGATTVEVDTKKEVFAAVKEMLSVILNKNNLSSSQIISALFTTTPDLKATFAAAAARDMGWTQVPLLDALQPPVAGSLPRCIRVLLLCATDTPQAEVTHVYLRNAQKLRPDIAENY